MIKKLLNRHSSLVVLGFSAASFFMLNLLLKDFLDVNEYALYSLFITYISILSSFGLMGTDQTFVRISSFKNNVFFTDKVLKKYIFIIMSSMPIVYTFIIWRVYLINYKFISILMITISMLSILFVYNILRLKMNFLLSQIINNSWKMFPIIILIILYLFKIEINLENIISSFLFIFLIVFIINISIIKKINFADKSSEINIFDMSLQNLISNFVLVIISFFDRIFIERTLGIVELANYFFLSNIFIFPFSLLQNYIGFKELVKFKENFSIKILNEKIIIIFKFSVLFSILLLFSSLIIDYLNIFNLNVIENIKLVLIMMLLGITRNIYSIVSAAGGAITNPKMSKTLNIISFSSLLLLIIPYYYRFSVEFVILFFLLIWIIRIVSIVYVMKKEYVH